MLVLDCVTLAIIRRKLSVIIWKVKLQNFNLIKHYLKKIYFKCGLIVATTIFYFHVRLHFVRPLSVPCRCTHICIYGHTQNSRYILRYRIDDFSQKFPSNKLDKAPLRGSRITTDGQAAILAGVLWGWKSA